jgi:hypothetical protein
MGGASGRSSRRGGGRRHPVRRFHSQFRDENRRGTGKSQSIWTDSKMETPGAPARPAAPAAAGRAAAARRRRRRRQRCHPPSAPCPPADERPPSWIDYRPKPAAGCAAPPHSLPPPPLRPPPPRPCPAPSAADPPGVPGPSRPPALAWPPPPPAPPAHAASFMSVHWVGVPEALRARRINRHPYLHRLRTLRLGLRRIERPALGLERRRARLCFQRLQGWAVTPPQPHPRLSPEHN